jgi:hypothetical protein
MNIVKENERVFDVKDEILLEKIKETLANWDGSCYYDDEKIYRADIVIGKQTYSIEVSAEIKYDDSNIVFGDSILVKRTR